MFFLMKEIYKIRPLLTLHCNKRETYRKMTIHHYNTNKIECWTNVKEFIKKNAPKKKRETHHISYNDKPTLQPHFTDYLQLALNPSHNYSSPYKTYKTAVLNQ